MRGRSKFADRLPSIFLARVIQTHTMARGNESRRQIPPQLDFLVILRARRPFHKNQLTR
jgi:hypothetical protein